MRCLVTGGAGFIGSWLCRELLRRGMRVTVLDDLSTGRRENIRALIDRDALRFVEGDIRDGAALERALEGCRRVYHLAASVGVREIARDPAESLSRNVAGSERVARAAASAGARLLFTSSSEIYGRGAFGFAEDAPLSLGPTSDPRWSYGCGKACTEFFVNGLRQSAGLAAVVVRLFNVVGPGQLDRYGMVLPTFVRQALRGEALSVAGDGRQRRTFAHVAEVVSLLAELMECPRAEGATVNLGGRDEISIRALAERVRAQVGSRSAIRHLESVELYGREMGDLPRRAPDLKRLEALLGKTPAIALERILDDVIRHERARLGRPSSRAG